MPGGRGKITGKDNTNGFQKNPQNINRSGANRKSYANHIKEIKAKGYEAPTKSAFYDMMNLILAMEEDDLKEFAKDKSKPYWIRLLIIDLNDKNARPKLMSDYRDWLFGKSEQKISQEATVKKIIEFSEIGNRETED